MNRRTFLAGSGTAIAGAFAGCTALAGSTGTGVVLTHVELGNASGHSRTFHLLVAYDGAIEHWSSHRVRAGTDDSEMGDRLVEIDAPEEPVETVVRARVGGQRTSVSFGADEYDGEDAIATFIYGPWRTDDGGYALRGARHVSDRPGSTETPEGL